ncbi:MAG: lysophospholipase L1-like esterase [Myxococcota bacterium]|jgi:lysophospholipase L1-like esterase
MANSDQAPNDRQRLFRLLAFGVPAALGVAILLVVATSRGMLEMNLEHGTLELRDPAKLMYALNHDESGHVVLYDETLGWRNPPNHKGRTFGNPLWINAKGLRGRDRPYAKPVDTRRILVLGDSYTWGFDVGDDEVFTEVLEDRLAEEPRKTEVINTGVSGWGTDQEYLFFIEEGVRYQPDVVVLAFYVLNDFNENTVSQQHGHYKPYFRDTNLTLAGVPVPKATETVEPEMTGTGAIEITVALIEGIKAECDKRDIEFVVMVFGTIFRPFDKQMLSYTEPFFEALAHVPGLQYFNLDDRFVARKIGRKQLVAGNRGAHWNAYGHSMAAEELHGYLREQGLVAAPR